MSKTVEDDDFVIYDRWDSNLANDGVPFTVIDNNGNNWGTFLCSHFNGSVPRIKHALERLERRKNANNKKAGGKDVEANLHAGIDVVLDTFLLDWEVTGKSGRAVPFTRDNAHKYFGRKGRDAATGETTYPASFIVDELIAKAKDPLNFQPEDQGPELPEGN